MLSISELLTSILPSHLGLTSILLSHPKNKPFPVLFLAGGLLIPNFCSLRLDFALIRMPVKDTAVLLSHLEEFIWESLLSVALSFLQTHLPPRSSTSCQLKVQEGWNGTYPHQETLGMNMNEEHRLLKI